ncbi:MAG TPA: hypothetical protein VFO19_10775 [Vicinamibacterales bacterium]|nr:hypothetical protein [Vicinamibacterales bacterium]
MIDLRLVPPSVWSPETARHAGSGNASDPWCDPGQLAHAVLWTLQDAHVGITPKLAHEIGRLLARAGPPQSSAWSTLFRRLQERLPRTGRSGIIAGSAPVYVVQNLVRPIVRAACAEIGYTCLLCQDEVDDAVSADEYAAYGARLERIASRIVAELAAAPLFAAEHGNVVAALSEPSPEFRSRVRVPQIDRKSLALLLGLDAEVHFREGASRSTPTPSYVPKRRPAAAAPDGRVEGLRQGRGEGQLGSMVLSEFLNPPLVLIDRLLNSGYLVHERRPRRAKLRDALIVGLMPHEVRATPQGAFAKACWADCMARLARRLVSARLRDSEFRWIEGDAAGRARRAAFPIGDVPADLAAGPHAAFRDAFLTLSRWVPDYFETRAGFHPLQAETIANVDEWVVAAWAAHVDRVDSFSFVHVMVFHPPIEDERGAASESARRLGTLRAGLRLGYRRRRQASVTYVPGDPDRDTRWHFGSDSDPYRALTPMSSDGAATLAGALQSSWLDRLTKDIWHG